MRGCWVKTCLIFSCDNFNRHAGFFLSHTVYNKTTSSYLIHPFNSCIQLHLWSIYLHLIHMWRRPKVGVKTKYCLRLDCTNIRCNPNSTFTQRLKECSTIRSSRRRLIWNWRNYAHASSHVSVDACFLEWIGPSSCLKTSLRLLRRHGWWHNNNGHSRKCRTRVFKT